jgi:hypothetical protein
MTEKNQPWWANLATLAVIGVIGLATICVGALVVLPVSEEFGIGLIIGGSTLVLGSSGAARATRFRRGKK